MQARNSRKNERSDRREYLDIAGWRVVDVLTETGSLRRYHAVARERAVLDEGDWLSATENEHPHPAGVTVPGDTVELIVEASAGAGLTLSELCELFDELEAPSIPELLDVGVTDLHETVAVIEATLGSSVEELMDRPIPLTGGEIVTILAPIAETLAELHQHGISLGALNCEDVRLTADGRPVLKNWQASTRLSEVGGRAHAGVLRDWKSFEHVTDLVLAQFPTETELPAALERELDRCLSGDVDAQLPARLLDAFFAWQDASEVHDPAGGEPAPRRALRAKRAVGESETRAMKRPDADARIHARSLLEEEPAPEFAALRRTGGPRDRSSRRVQRDRRRPGVRQRLASAIRMPYRIAGAAAVVMCVCAATLGLLDGAPTGGEESHPGTSHSSVTADQGAPEVQAQASPAEGAPANEGTSAGVPEEVSADWRTGAASDDPARAAIALLERRAECLASSPEGCLEEVYQSDAPGLHADLARTPGPGHELVGLTSATLRDRYGDFAVIDLWATDAVQAAETPPASLTIARGEAGWRLRDVRVA